MRPLSSTKYYQVFKVRYLGVVHLDNYPLNWSNDKIDNWLRHTDGWDAACGQEIRSPADWTDEPLTCLLCLARDDEKEDL